MSDNSKVAIFKPKMSAGPECLGPVLDTGRLVSRDGADYILMDERGATIKCQKAAGCLLAPEVGDMVLIARGGREGHFILTVLKRGQSESRIVFEGDARVMAGGQLQIEGREVNLGSRTSVTIEAPEVKLGGLKGLASFLNFSLVANLASVRASRLTAVAAAIETMAERVTMRLKDCFRWVSRIDQTRAGRVSLRSEEHLEIKAGQASIQAEGELKMDGEKIRLG